MKKILPKLTPKQKKIIDIVVTSLEVVVVLIAIIASAIIIANPNPVSADVSKGAVKLLPVLTGSMDGDQKDSFKKGDLVIAGNPKDVLQLKEGQIITFKGSVEGYDALITHRIIEVLRDSDGNALTYITHGDANPEGRNETVNPYNVLAVYKSHLKGVGKSISWLQEPTHFLLIIVLPLGLLFLWNIAMFIRMIFQWKMEKVKANGGGAIDEEEIKRKAIEEYLASQNSAENKDENDSIDEDDNKDENVNKVEDEEKSGDDNKLSEENGEENQVLVEYDEEDMEPEESESDSE